MSQRAVERAIGKLVTDEAFRERFATDPAGASLEAGLALSSTELAALVHIPAEALAQLAERVDDRIRRLAGSPCGIES